VDFTYLEAHRLRIELLRKLKRYHDVVRSCDAVLTDGKPSADLYEFRGLAKEKLRDYQGAIEDQTLAIALRPGSAPLMARRGALYLVTDAPRSALRDFEQAIHIDSTNPDPLLGRGLALAALGQHGEAIADAVKALKMTQPTETRLYNAARIHALAAIAVAAEARKRGRDAMSETIRYQDQAIRLLREWQKRLPTTDRAASFRDLLQDPVMSTLRRRLRSLELTGNATESGPRPGADTH
jgi:tetratricopeptide (TPR) repeat protein